MSADIDIDCSGLTCPIPVIKTRERIAEGGGAFSVFVDNDAACENVSRFAGNSGCSVEVSSVEGGFIVRVTPGEKAAEAAEPLPVTRQVPAGDKVIFIGSDELGRGERELGTALAKAFLYACTENEDRPSKMVFMNSGVRLVTENDETVAHVKQLEDGVSCVTTACLTERVQVFLQSALNL
ncbi:MAG: sulfurtransferase-like selenium metabolism protein YedF [Actinobacteria bacterium]|nr:sulfurtransferase-like selenium metabolism protein YedF [Actinomycetota bacterium]MCG2818994.1 sulfurtransferase-like selenium metabolism protein YedF [Actinomycetes bacterium]MBU4179101.1 sulfurtransferase-like selenium metabolism protein YedF [Actinomycetota bacterium]MBU4217834.1 sulfurtransferase-like selenium metabolism protein YedF [Actinomycetota bacterium]MBU4359328.1 sulfurtransferase-like selenium metabolism protein YedF [Actinomycetota bacterium]